MASSIFFQGSIPQAIAEAQSNRRILVVFISGEDEESQQLVQVTWQDSKVIEEIQRGCVALKIAGGSTDAVNFSAIFPTRRVPSISIIGFTGALLQQHEGYITPEEFVAGLQQVLVTFTPQLQNVAAAGAIATILSSAHLAQTATTPTISEAENGTTASLPEPSSEPIQGSASVLSREISPPPVERGSSNVEPSQREGAGVAATNVSEIQNATPSTRSVGETVQDNQALEAIKAAQAMKTALKAKAKKVESDLKAAGALAAKTSKEQTGPFLLQIRLTNSENIRGEFEANNTLRDVKSFVDKNRTDGRKNYSFVIPFPRKSLSNDDLDKSLTQLELGPRSTVMIVHNRNSSEGSSWSCATASEWTDDAPTPAAGGGSFIGRIWSYLNPLAYFRWGGYGNNQDASGSDWEYDSVPAEAREADGRESRDGTTGYTSPINGAGPQRSSLNQRKGWGANGNVHTLRNDDDEVFRGGNSYWNGNSTQFGGEDDNKRD